MRSILPYAGHTELGRPRVAGVAPVPTDLEVGDSDPYPKVWKNSLRRTVQHDSDRSEHRSLPDELFTVCVLTSFSQGPNSDTELNELNVPVRLVLWTTG